MGTVIQETTKRWAAKRNEEVIEKTPPGWESFFDLNTRRLSEGTYRYDWYVEVRLKAGSRGSPMVRVKTGASIRGFHTFREDDPAWQHFSGWGYLNIAKGVKQLISMECNKPGAGSIEIRRSRVSIEYKDRTD